MRKALIIAAMTIFVFGCFWQFGRWLLRWSGYGLGLRSLPGGYHEFVDSFAEKIAGAMKGIAGHAPWSVALLAGSKFAKPFNVIRAVQPGAQKYFAQPVGQIIAIVWPVPPG